MSLAVPTPADESGAGKPTAAPPRPTWTDRWHRFEAWLERGSELLNPILVKECRQALKSNQFLITFALVLALTVLWSIGAVMYLMPAIYYLPMGQHVLFGYLLVLTLPLSIMVPFMAFRSIGAEQEDGTYELISITSLTARQIVWGKLGSSIAQMGVYYAAVAPCIVFTYLLNGVSLVTLFLVLLVSFVSSLVLSALGLLAGTLSRSRVVQVFLSVLVVVALLIAAVIVAWWMGILTYAALLTSDPTILLLIVAAIVTITTPLIVLIVQSAAANISFLTSNRSTPQRWTMVVFHAVVTMWILYVAIVSESGTGGVLTSIPLYLFWALMGIFLVSEPRFMAARVKRTLPSTVLGRVFLTWFNPGPSTGYFFVIASSGSATLIFGLGTAYFIVTHGANMTATYQIASPPSSMGGMMTYEAVAAYLIAVTLYLVNYLGVGTLCLALFRWLGRSHWFLSILVHGLLILFGALVPLGTQQILVGGFDMSYSPLQASNIVWTMQQILDGTPNPDVAMALLILAIAAVPILGANLVLAVPEILRERTSAPVRVVEDERERHPGPAAAPADPFADVLAERAVSAGG